MTGTVHQFPGLDHRFDPVLAAPADAVAIVQAAVERLDRLADLISQAAPAPEVTAAAEALAAVRGPLRSLGPNFGLYKAVLDGYRGQGRPPAAAWGSHRSRQRPAPAGNETAVLGPQDRAQLYAIPGPQDHATGSTIAPAPDGGQAPGGAA